MTTPIEPLIPPPMFKNRNDIDNLTPEQADLVLELARQNLADLLYSQNEHHHLLDDCGDYLNASTTIWHTLFTAFFENDGDPVRFVATVQQFLRYESLPDLACDGDIRYTVLDDDLRDALWADAEDRQAVL